MLITTITLLSAIVYSISFQLNRIFCNFKMLKSSSNFINLLKVRCPNCFKFENYATRKRFYRGTGIVQNDKKWEITLDHRKLKTPNGAVLTVSSEPLARAIAHEWDAQIEVITQPTMHLTALCNTALDNPGKLSSHDITSYLIDFIPTDTLLFYSDEEAELKDLQERKWGSVLDWFQDRFGVKQEISTNLEPPPVSTKTRAVLAQYFLSYNFPALNAICFGVEALKSPLLMLACIERQLDPHEAVMLSRLEEEYQLSRWGRVPWAHEVNQAELSARVAASLLVIHCSSETNYITKKSSN